MTTKSLVDTIKIVITQNDTGSIATIKALYDYNTSNGSHSIVFKASDATLILNPAVLDTINNDSTEINLNINAVNDAPEWWSPVPDTTMVENDTFRIDLAHFVKDVDDSLLAFKLYPTSFGNYTLYDPITGVSLAGYPKPGTMEIQSSEYPSEGFGDSTALFIPTELWSGYAEIEAIVTDSIDNPQNPKSDTTIFIIDIIRIPRPHITFDIVQNNVFTSYYDILITDTISKATNVSLYIDGNLQDGSDSLQKVGPFTYRSHKEFIQKKEGDGVALRAVANAVVGDTVKYDGFDVTHARTLSSWGGSSFDGLFRVIGEAGAVTRNQFILIVDSTIFKKGYSGSYKLGDEARWFSKPVEVSLASYDDDQALYQRNSDNSWIELPSYSQQGRIRAYTDRMGYFRLGRKTLIVPGLTTLGQNYPNPFNPVTNITYDVGFVDGPNQQVNLSIYNLLGQHVQTLVRGQQGPGQYKIMWYGRDKSGVSVASGIYFVHMTTSAGKVQTKKVMLLR